MQADHPQQKSLQQQPSSNLQTSTLLHPVLGVLNRRVCPIPSALRLIIGTWPNMLHQPLIAGSIGFQGQQSGLNLQSAAYSQV
jgi:hypothetical protein